MWRVLLILSAVLTAVNVHAAVEGSPIAEVRFDPRDQPLPPEWRDQLVTLRPGSPLRPADVRQSIRNLFATGRYGQIEAHGEESSEGVVVTFRTRSSFFVGDVDVTGVDAPPTRSQLITAARLRLGELYSEQDLALAQQQVRQLLIDNGFVSPLMAVESVEHPDVQQVDVTLGVRTAERAAIGDLIVTGDSGLSEQEVREITGWRAGRPYRDQLIRKGLANLREGLHERGRWQAEAEIVGRDYNSAERRITLILRITEGPQVEVAVEGAKFSEKQLERLIPVFEEGAVDDDLIAEGRRNLRDQLQRQGFFDVSVASERRRPSADAIVVSYRIERGERQRLAEVMIDGAEYFDVATIRERMLLAESGFPFGRGRYSEALLDRDLDAIRALYRSNGFRDVAVDARVEKNWRGSDDAIAVAIDIHEGSQTFVEELIVNGMQALRPGQAGFQLASSAGQPFSESSVATDRDLILAEYYSAGFRDATFAWRVRPGSAPDLVVVEYQVEEGDRLFVRRPIVSGLVHTDPELVERRILLRPDEPLSQTAMFESQRRLYDLGIFSRVEVALQNPQGEEPSKNVLFQLEEARRWTIGFGGGAEFARIGGGDPDLTAPLGEAAFSPRVTLELSRLNFRGIGHTLTLRTRLSNLQQRALFTYEDPRWTNSEKWRLTLSGLWDTSRNVRTFTGSRLEGAFQLEHRLSKPSTALYRYTFRRTTIDEESLQISPILLPLTSQPVRAALLSGTYIQDRRDDPTDAAQGVFNTVDISIASGAWGSQPDFFRFFGQNSSYYRLARRVVLARTVQLGFMVPWGAVPAVPPNVAFDPDVDPRIPLSERFFAGGANSHRGFPVNQAGPRDPQTGFPIGGAAEFLNSVELRFPLLGANIGGVLFHDAGNVYSRPGAMDFGGEQDSIVIDGTPIFEFDYMVHAVGFGLRYRTPVGPIRLDLAYSLNSPRFFGFEGTRQELLAGQGTLREQRIQPFQFHFSIGQTF